MHQGAGLAHSGVDRRVVGSQFLQRRCSAFSWPLPGQDSLLQDRSPRQSVCGHLGKRTLRTRDFFYQCCSRMSACLTRTCVRMSLRWELPLRFPSSTRMSDRGLRSRACCPRSFFRSETSSIARSWATRWRVRVSENHLSNHTPSTTYHLPPTTHHT